MQKFFKVITSMVHYRIGSLEITFTPNANNDHVHYRIGSLENKHHHEELLQHVHYRIGSLEIVTK